MNKAIKDLDIFISDGNYSSKYPRSEEFVEGGVPFIRANNLLDGDIIDEDMYFISREKHSILLKGHVKSGDVLITTRGNIGQVAIVPDRHEDSNINAQIVLLRTKQEQLFNRYLFWALQSQASKEQYLALQTGTALKQMPVGKLEQLKIRVADIEEQHKVARNLDQAFRLIKDRQEELTLLDNLVKARFVELFGDKKYEKKQLIELIKEGAGLSYGIVVPGDNVPNGIPMVRPSDYKNGSLNLDNVYRVASDIECKYKKTRLIGDEILVQVIGQPGQVMLSDKRCKGMNVTRNLAVVRIDKDKAERLFISHYLTSEEAQRFMFGSTNQSTLKQLPLNKLKELPVPQVPLSEQGEFADFIKQVDKSKSVIQKSLDETQLLFNSLMQEYFG